MNNIIPQDEISSVAGSALTSYRKLLYVTPFHDSKLHSGAAIRSHNLCRELARQFQVTVLAATETHNDVEISESCDANVIRSPFFKPVKRNKSMMLRILGKSAPGFSAIDVDLLKCEIDKIWEKEGSFDVLYFVTQMTASVLLIANYTGRIIIDMYDYYLPIALRKCESVPKHKLYHWVYRIEANKTAVMENNVLRCADDILIPTEEEADKLRLSIKNIPIHVIENGTIIPECHWQDQGSSNVLFVGNFTYGPNMEGLQWVLEKVWPSIRHALPDSCLRIVGKGCEYVKIPRDSGVIAVGPVDDLSREYISASCCIIPILNGGGSRLKLLEAMAYGIPIVSTTLGASGIRHEGSIITADSSEDFSNGIIACLGKENNVLAHCQRAAEIILRLYTWDKIGGKLRRILQT